MQYASHDICKRLAAVHDQARLAWDGENKTFGLVQLLHKKDFDKTFREPWGDKGPIFSKTGSTLHDWDPWVRTPVYVIDVDPADVHSGKVIELVKRWIRPIASRLYEDAKDRGQNLENKVEAMGHEMGDRLFKTSQANGAGSPIVAKKFVNKTRNQERLERGELSLENKLLPATPPGGWESHLAKDQGDAGDLGEIG